MARRSRRTLPAAEGGGGAGGHDGAGSMRWLLTYADLITLLMVFFIVLYAMSKVDVARYEALAASLRSAFLSQPSGNAVIDATPAPTLSERLLPAAEPGGGGEGPTLAEIGQELAAALEANGLRGQVEVVMTERGLRVSFAEEVLFALGRAELFPEAKALFLRIAPILARIPNPIDVQGFTDDLPIRTAMFPSNWELSARRATNVVRFLSEEAGLDPARFTATAKGEWHPRVPNDSPENRARNRRVEILILNAGAGGEAVRRVFLPFEFE